jgi:hypothetical protein
MWQERGNRGGEIWLDGELIWTVGVFAEGFENHESIEPEISRA